MKKTRHLLLLITIISAPLTAHGNTAIDTLLKEYQQAGADTFSAASGKALWMETHSAQKKPQKRSCTSCHAINPLDAGQHVRTRKSIEPIARSVNPERLTDLKQIRKWLKRNCKWTLGRECSAQEKGDILVYLKKL